MSLLVKLFQACIVFLNFWLTLQYYAPKYPYHGFAYHGSSALHKGLSPLCTLNSSANCGRGSTYFDRRQNSLRHLKGGGTIVLVDYSRLCSNGFLGVKQHPQQPQYYYDCHEDNVVFAKCGKLEIFNVTSLSCQPYEFLSYFQPVCTYEGRYPVPYDGSYYYRCNGNMEPRIYSCPSSQTFSPFLKTCIPNMVNVPTLIAENSVALPTSCEKQFPSCKINGTFSSPHSPSIYYTCVLHNNNVFLQTRYKCPEGSYFDAKTNTCVCLNIGSVTVAVEQESTSLLTTTSIPTELTTETTDFPTAGSLSTTEIEITETTNSNKILTEFPTSTISDSTTQTVPLEFSTTELFSTSTSSVNPSTTLENIETTFEATTSSIESTTMMNNDPCIPDYKENCDFESLSYTRDTVKTDIDNTNNELKTQQEGSFKTTTITPVPQYSLSTEHLIPRSFDVLTLYNSSRINNNFNAQISQENKMNENTELDCDKKAVDLMQVLVFKWPLDIHITDCTKEPCHNNIFGLFSNDEKAVGINWSPA